MKPNCLWAWLDSLWNPTMCWLDCVCMVLLCVSLLFSIYLWKSCPYRGWKCCWETNEHTSLWLGGTLQWLTYLWDNFIFKDKYSIVLFLQCICLWICWIWWMLVNDFSRLYCWLNVPSFASIYALYISMHFLYDHGG